MYPNGRYLTATAGRQFGPGAGLEVLGRNLGDRFAKGFGTFAPTASAPDGYGMAGLVPPRVAGSMSALGPVAAVAGAASLLQGAPMVGTAAMTLTPDPASLGLVVSMSGDGAFSLAGAGSLAGVVQLTGTAALTFAGTAGLSMIVPFEGAGSFSFAGSADLRGRLSMQGEWTPFTALSPEGLAAAVWERIIESGFSAEQVLRIVAAQAAGDATGLEGPSAVFKSLDGTKNRIVGTYSAGTRNVTAVDGS